jgi:hypothetical protein
MNGKASLFMIDGVAVIGMDIVGPLLLALEVGKKGAASGSIWDISLAKGLLMITGTSIALTSDSVISLTGTGET